jgi:hypothetical protein
MFIDNGPQEFGQSSVGAKYYRVSISRSYGAWGRRVCRYYKHPAPTELNGATGCGVLSFATWQHCDPSNTVMEDYSRFGNDLISVFSAPPQRSLRLGGECFRSFVHHRDAEVAEAAQRISTLGPTLGSLIFVVNRRAKISESEKFCGRREVRLFILMRQTENAVAAKAHINAGRFQQP